MGGIAHGELDNGQEGVHTRQTDESTRQMETVYADMQTCRHADMQPRHGFSHCNTWHRN